MNRAKALRTLGRYASRSSYTASGHRESMIVTPNGFDVSLISVVKTGDHVSTRDAAPFLDAVQYLINNPPAERKRRSKRKTSK